MNTTHTHKSRIPFVLLFLLLLCVAPRLTTAQDVQNTNGGTGISRLESRQISAVRSETNTKGSRVILMFNEMPNDYGAYRNGDKFTVVLPSTQLALSEISLKGNGFTNPKVEARGTNLVFSFQLDPKVNASVSEAANRIEIAFTKASTDAESVVPTAESSDANANGDTAPAAPEGEPSTRTSLTNERPNRSSNRSTALRDRSANASSGVGTVVPPTAPAEATGGEGDKITAREIDLSVPESPAFTVLGVTPETVTKPTTAREFSTALLNGVDQKGNFQTGLAFDFVPYLTFFGNQTSLFTYRKHPMERFLARTQLSFATTKGASEEDKSSRLALGVRLTLWDRADPRLDDLLDKCYTEGRAAARDRLRALGEPPDEEEPPAKALRLRKREEILAEITKPCNDTARKRNWNGSAWIVGAAPSWISETGKTKDFRWNGGGFWTSLAYGFEGVSALEDNSQLIVHARYRGNEIVPDPGDEGQFVPQDSFFFGGRLRMAPGSGAKSIFSVEANYIRSRLNKGPYDNSTRFSLGLERRIADGIWFSLALGGQGGRADGENKPFVLTSFRWGFDKK